MNTFNRKFLLSCASLLLAGSVWAQPGAGRGGGMGPGAGPRPCMKGDAPAGPMCDWRMNRRNTPGMGLMTQDERSAHRDRMRGFQSREECIAYITEHHAQMAARAKAKGRTLPEPRLLHRDRLPPAGK